MRKAVSKRSSLKNTRTSFRYPYVAIDRKGKPIAYGISPEVTRIKAILESGSEPEFIIPLDLLAKRRSEEEEAVAAS